MKKIIVCTLFLFSHYLVMAQLIIQPLLPQVGMFQKNQLWNLIVINSSNAEQQCYVVLSLQDRQTGSEILSATTASFLLSKGSKQLNTGNLAPIQYTYLSYSNKTNDFLTAGSYMACFKLMGKGHNGDELAEACVPFDVQPLSPPMLIMPSDSSVLQVQPAQFTWQPPAPITMFQQLHYQILIAEILPGQQPQEAVELNAPFYMDLNVSNNMINYAGAYPSFQEGKWYAWEIVAQDGENYAAKSPVWDFMIAPKKVPLVVPTNGNYILLKSDREASEGVHILTDQNLGIKYYSFDKDYAAIIHFMGPDGKIIEQATEQIVYGSNFLGYKLGSNFKKGVVYTVEIIDNKGNKDNAFFLIK
jgi:hypothetical protein